MRNWFRLTFYICACCWEMAAAFVVAGRRQDVRENLRLQIPTLYPEGDRPAIVIALVNRSGTKLICGEVYSESGEQTGERLAEIGDQESLIFAPQNGSGFLIYSLQARNSAVMLMWMPDAWNMRIVDARPRPSAALFTDLYHNGAKIGDESRVVQTAGSFQDIAYRIQACMKRWGTPTLKIALTWDLS